MFTGLTGQSRSWFNPTRPPRLVTETGGSRRPLRPVYRKSVSITGSQHSYGGRFKHGGGGFNGKDPTKVDITGAVGARYLAKALVAEKLCRKAEIEVSYVIGRPDPLAVNIDTFGTETRPEKIIYSRAKGILDLSVDGIIEGLDLFNPAKVKYKQAAVGGWFGRLIFPWEQV